MIPPAGAREVATAALARLDRPDTTDLPARIASGAVLADSDLTRIRAFWETVEPQPDVPAWRLAAALLGGEPMRRTIAASPEPAPVTAAAGPREFSRAAEVLSTVSADLAQIDRDTAIEVRTAVELGWKSALDRVGRMVTRTSSADRSTPAIEVAVAANADQVDAVNPAKLIEPAVADTARHVKGVLERARTQTETVIAEAFFVDLDNVWTNPVGPVAVFLGSRMTADLLTRLSAAPAADRVDPTNNIDPYLAPYQITRDVLAAAGGASLLGDRVGRDDIGRPVSADGTPGNDTIGSGPDAQRAIDDSIAAHARTGITADATQRGFVPAELSEELAEVAALLAAAEADTEPLERVATYTWRINWNGTAEENLPAHEIMDGTIAASPSDILRMADAAADINEWPYVGARHPGDHPYCHCGWEVSYQLVPRQLAL